MNILIQNLGKDYNAKIVFENINGKVNEGEKIGLIGANGIGKTTLVKLISGREGADRGSISISPDRAKIVYLSQSLNEYNEEEFYRNSEKHSADLKKLMQQIGIEEESLGRPADTLSGGEKTKLMLSNVLLEASDLLILDEPTNHLDIESISFLEKIINNIPKTMIIISHDRYFLDKTVNKIWELTKNELREYTGNYQSYKEQKEIEQRNIQKEYEKQQREIKHLNEIIIEKKQWFEKAHNAAGQNDFYRAKAKKHISVMRSKEKQLDRIKEKEIEKPREEISPCFQIINKNIINMKLPHYIMEVNKLKKCFGKKQVLQSVSFQLCKGDKTAVTGRNGSGKTTLLRIINGIDRDYEGKIYINPSIKTAYFSQQLENLSYDKSILDNLLDEGVTAQEARTLLASLLFRGDDVFKNVGVLSLGERCRVSIARIILSGANLLILDEPTNYMDIVSKEKIEEVLKLFKGSIIFVSHDRYFMNAIANRIFELEDGKIKIFDGNYDFYLTKKQENAAAENSAENYKSIRDNIAKLECELAFLSGKLDEKLEEEEKQQLNDKFLKTAKELRRLKEKINR